ncbi:4-hydroxythreonine-4-phosphate dehydrogenase PdxA [Prochlorococcus sp. MIT 1223]|uniref:4-hydroxythreonine-4-phosphate dehydrogenase PdxA n=1 Tax=Prochlorococcus sp. MIT 1223 TaxID=3096217 RepID=UPI002A7572F4|nr:4-hydroxythreonine-4-phosphate dehydrogenase PdxA [Prochlorococcus sp. MIT 1223]
MKSKLPIIISTGDPAGIGIEIILKSLYSLESSTQIDVVLVGCKKSIELAHRRLIDKKENVVTDLSKIEIINIPLKTKIEYGKPTEITGNASFKYLNHAASLVMQKKGRALVTAPIAKFAWHKAGHLYDGQTELLAELTNTRDYSMLFTAKSPVNGWRLNTLLATTHIPIKQVPEDLNTEKIISKLDSLLNFCQRFKHSPKLAIAGLNPHAGEEGHIGNEEKNWLSFAINKWRDNHPEIVLDGPLPPDTCWLSAAKSWEENTNSLAPDGLLALYHDQGLIAVKLIAFDYAVNTTLGLPFIRTSPDHGTAFDIAGKGVANPNSMLEAIKTAWELSNKPNPKQA